MLLKRSLIDINNSIVPIYTNCTEYWEFMVPERFEHRTLLLQSTNVLADYLVVLLQLHNAIVKQHHCTWRISIAIDVVELLEEMSSWAVLLGSGPLTLRWSPGGYFGPGDVVKGWIHHIGYLTQRYLVADLSSLCGSGGITKPNVTEQANLVSRVTSLILAVSDTVKVWPFLVDSAAVANAARPAVLPHAMQPHRMRLDDKRNQVLDYLLGELLGANGPQPKPLLMMEIGVHRAETSEYLLDEFETLELVGVDPYLGHYDMNHSAEGSMGSSSLYAIAAAVYDRYRPRSVLHRMTSLDLARDWTGKSRRSFDIVYIDAEHDFESCAGDIRAWAPHVRPGGIVSGHDYGSRFVGVPKAVNLLVPTNATLFLAPYGTWFWVQPTVQQPPTSLRHSLPT